ncbi:hypothetical protein M7I_1837 [Glarea lozoyensis 74030]|uniref:Uncharacterized protein n=1 Tax=Glarea lozoyensis (strain ATCC 74030 / MF5533) TaxID=1104152 RepID=H0EGX9_GLAL7|nr:hypothetical protein M7I_1837 [Glarea lozoyensis 74030]
MVENYIYNPATQATIISGETSFGSNDGETPLMSVTPKDFGDRFVASLVMLGASIVGVVYSRKTIVPDYLGYVSSLAKESQYIRMPDVGVNMDGIDKARLVKDVKVKLGDVSEQPVTGDGQGMIGRLAFARAEDCRNETAAALTSHQNELSNTISQLIATQAQTNDSSLARMEAAKSELALLFSKIESI